MSHYMNVGTCGHIMGQCRCPGPKQTRHLDSLCPACEKRTIEGEEPREYMPMMLDFLRSMPRGEQRAHFIEDVFEEVFRQLRRDDLKDAEWLSPLRKALHLGLSECAPEGTSFGSVGKGQFGWFTEVVPGQGPSITCPVCSMTSYHPEDIRQRYCGNCHAFHDDMERQP